MKKHLIFISIIIAYFITITACSSHNPTSTSSGSVMDNQPQQEFFTAVIDSSMVMSSALDKDCSTYEENRQILFEATSKQRS